MAGSSAGTVSSICSRSSGFSGVSPIAASSSLPEKAAHQLPSLPPQAEPVLMFGYDGGALSYYKAQVPKTLIGAIAALASGK